MKRVLNLNSLNESIGRLDTIELENGTNVGIAEVSLNLLHLSQALTLWQWWIRLDHIRPIK